LLPIVFTVSGIVIDFKLLLFLKASVSISPTSTPSKCEGITMFSKVVSLIPFIITQTPSDDALVT